MSSARSGTCASTSRSRSRDRGRSGGERTKLELIALCISITFVLIAEMLNTAIEAAIDIATTSFDPMAKLAKDIAAGAVLIADQRDRRLPRLRREGRRPLVASARPPPAGAGRVHARRPRPDDHHRDRHEGLHRRGTPLRGGLPSGHAALAFAGWMAIDLHNGRRATALSLSSVALILAFLVAQTRVESGIHSALEVTYGGLVGALATLVVFQVFS